MFFNRKLFGIVVIVLALAISACSGTTAQTTKKVDLTFVSHLAAEMPEQDVFVEISPGSDQVQRITVENSQTYMDAPVYASQAAINHDPFQLGDAPVGPYAKGADLGFTMDEWLAGTATGTYTVTGDEAQIDLSFEKLVPNGVYTVWCAHINVPPNFSIVDEPCGAADGSQNVFTAGADGKAEFNLSVDALPDTTDETIRVIAAAYHSDGKTYGSYPGDFGLNSHVQILAFIPEPEDTAWQIVTDDNSVAQR